MLGSCKLVLLVLMVDEHSYVLIPTDILQAVDW